MYSPFEFSAVKMDENSPRYRCCLVGFHVKYAAVFIGMIEIIYISLEVPFNMFLIAPKLTPPDPVVLVVGIILHVTVPVSVLASAILMLAGVSVRKYKLVLQHIVTVFCQFSYNCNELTNIFKKFPISLILC